MWIFLLLCTICFGHFQDQFQTVSAKLPYENHPYEKKQPLTESLAIGPLRIQMDFTELRKDLNGNNLQNAQTATSQAIEYLETLLNVHQTSVFQIDRCQKYSSNGQYCTNFYSNWIDGTMCDGLLPNNILKPLTYYSGGQMRTLPGGNGISGADMYIMIQSKNTENCGGGTLMYAGPCVRDNYNRPIAGTVNFCPSSVANLKTDWGHSVGVITHELMHALGFTKDSWDKFWDSSTGDVRPESSVHYSFTERGHTVYKIVSPMATQHARIHFSCSFLDGAELEDNGGAGTARSHWEKRVFNNEIMVGQTSIGDTIPVSNITLGLFEDSGWYTVNYGMSGDHTYGKNQGCDFASNYCLIRTSTTPTNHYPDYFCKDNGVNACLPDLSAVGSCSLSRFSSSLPTYDQYFADSKIGGNQIADFCPQWSPSSWNGGSFKRQCWNKAGYDQSSWKSQGDIMGETYGANSRCVVGTIIGSGYVEQNFGGRCVQISCSSSSLTIMVGGAAVANCGASEKGQTKTINSGSYKGRIKCPDYGKVCFNMNCGAQGRWTGSTCRCNPGFAGVPCKERN